MDNKARYKKRNGFRFLDLFIIVFFLSIAAVSLYLFRMDLLNTFRLQGVEPAGTVIIKKNTVQRRLDDRVIWDRLNRESPVYVGDLIRVAEISAATLNIKDNFIDLDENTLIRIELSPDGDGLQITMKSGTVTLFPEKGEEKVSIYLEAEKREIKPEQETVLRVTVPENGEQPTEKRYESVQKFIEEAPLRKAADPPRLLSPAANSIFHYGEDLPSLNFQWTNIDEASSYTLQVSSSPDFSNPRNIKTSATSVSVNSLEQGLWYWRVKLDLPPPYNANSVFSNVSFFRTEQRGTERAAPVQNSSIAQWLAEEAPSLEPPPEVPREILQENSFPSTPTPAVQAQESEPVTPPPERTPPPPVLFDAPQVIQPARGTVYGFERLQSQRTINFRWSPVRGANAYIFTLYEQTGNRKRQILRSTINRSTRYTMDNLRLLERGTFVWQVEAIRMGRGNVIEQHGRTTDNIFRVSFPMPGPVEIEDTGILYGN